MATCAVMAASSMVRMSASAAKYDCSNGEILRQETILSFPSLDIRYMRF